MKCHRLHEVLELLQPYWSKEIRILHLLQILQIANEAGFDKPDFRINRRSHYLSSSKCTERTNTNPFPELKKIMKKVSKLHCLKHVVFLNKGRIYEKAITDIILAFAVTANAYALDIQDGKQYISVNGQRSVQPEVVEFFSFYCPLL